MGYHKEIRRKNPKAKCFLCEVLMSSRFGGKGRKLYCGDCITNYGKAIYNLWHRRAYQKRTGKPVEPITREAITGIVSTDKRYKSRKDFGYA